MDKSCKYCFNITEFYNYNQSKCKKCIYEYNKKYNKKYKDMTNEQKYKRCTVQKRYIENHKEKIDAYQKKYRERKRMEKEEKLREKVKQYEIAHPNIDDDIFEAMNDLDF